MTDGGMWTNGSDADSKTAFASTDGAAMLRRVAELPIRTWRYKGEDKSIRHVGPTAQDFHAAFGLGAGDKHIGTVDADGVALAAIQGLHQLVGEKSCEIAELRKANQDLQARLARLEATVSVLTTAPPRTND